MIKTFPEKNLQNQMFHSGEQLSAFLFYMTFDHAVHITKYISYIPA